MLSPSERAPASTQELPSWRLLARLWAIGRPYRARVALATIALIVSSGLGLVYPWYFGELLGDAFADRDVASLDRNALILLAVFALSSALIFVRHYLMSWVGERVVADLRRAIFSHLLTVSQRYYQRHPTGALLSRQSADAAHLHKVIASDLSAALGNLLTLVGGVGMAFVVSPTLTLVALVVVVPLAGVEELWGRMIRSHARAAQDRLAEAAGHMQEALAGVETVQTFTRERFEVGRYNQHIERAFALVARRARAHSGLVSISSFLVSGAIAAVFWSGGRMVASGELEPAELGKFFLYTLVIANAVGSLADVLGSSNQTLGIASRLFELLDHEPELRDVEGALALVEPRGEVRFEGVSFSYDERERVLDDLELDLRPGLVCALVGVSGSGKTTIGRLLLRLWDPQAGRITFDGHDLRELELASLRGAIAEVSQRPWLFSGTIRENIRYGRLEASDAEVEAAAAAANAAAFIREFSAGFDTLVGERGVNLSGGQLQRLAIARALLRDPKVLILDEATSALDGESERLVQAALERLQRGRTTLVIAHRLSTIRDADRIVVLERGRVVEAGTHDELVAQAGAYARLLARSARAGQPDDRRYTR